MTSSSRIYCSLSNADHLIEKNEVVLLTSGKFACRDCFERNGNLSELVESSTEQISNEVKSSNIEDLFLILNERYKSKLETFKSNLDKIEKRIDLEIEFIIEEIDIRIESVRNEMENMKNELINELTNYKNEFNTQIKRFNSEEFEKNYNELKNCVSVTETSFYKHQSQLKNLNSLLEELQSINDNYHISIRINTENKLNKRIIGKLNCSYTGIRRNAKSKGTIVNLEYEPLSMCELPNGNLLTANYDDENLTLYDSELKLIKTITTLNQMSLEPLSVATDSKENVYILSVNAILMTDLELNFKKEVSPDLYMDLISIEYHDDHIYACALRRTIYKFKSNDLTFKSEYSNLAIEPGAIKIINKTACVLSYKKNQIYFYDLNFHAVKREISRNTSTFAITSHNEEFILVDSNFSINFYDDAGSFIETIKINYKSATNCIVYKNKLLINLKENKMIIY